jgi:hypothetical protein
MYCPQCGQQQASGEMRFCSRCGFPLTVVAQVVAEGGLPVARDVAYQERKISPRQKGIRQGAMLMLSTMLVVPLIVFAILLSGIDHLIPLIPLAAVVCFVGGLLRIFYALMFEEAAPAATSGAINSVAAFAPAELNPASRSTGAALPPAQVNTLMDWQRTHQTAEIIHPPSVTENTTKLLDRNDEE